MERQIVTLCGSTKFKKQYEHANLRFTLEGKIVLTVGCFMHHDGIPITTEQKIRLDILHKDKISMSDMVYVIDVGGYIGDSTKSEIEHAKKLGIPIRYHSEEKPPKIMPVIYHEINGDLELSNMDDKEKEKLIRELLEIAYRLYQTSCRIQKMTPLEFKDWILRRY